MELISKNLQELKKQGRPIRKRESSACKELDHSIVGHKAPERSASLYMWNL